MAEHNLKPAPPQGRSPTVTWLLAFLVAILAGALIWQATAPERDAGDPLGASLLAFQKQNRLTVFSAQVAPVVSAEDSRLFGTLNSRQVAVIPARVDYALDLSQMDESDLAWDAGSRRLEIVLPQLEASKPNLDEARAQYLREGVWITREAQDKLTRTNTRTAERLALAQASSPALIALAKAAAKEAVRQNLAIPLQVAGYGDIVIDVRFEGERAPD